MARLPLEGIRVLESSYVFALPYAAGLMADLGAEVIKVEGPGRPDTTRTGGFAGAHADNNPGDDPWNRTATFNMLNRGKKSVVLDLSKPEGLNVFKELIQVSDIVMENFTPRVMRRWELDYPNMKKLKPDVVMVSNTGYGHGAGPYSEYPAQATTQEATHGLTHITGYPGDIPSKAGQSFVDFLACWACLLGVALALRHRNRTGKGLWLDIGMYQLGAFTTSEYILDWLANGRISDRIGNRHPWRAPQGSYQCAGKDQWCVISVGDDEEWAALCSEIGRPDMAADSRFTTHADRVEHHDEIDTAISAWTRALDKFAVMERLQGVGVPCGPIFDSKDTSLDPHHLERGFLEKIEYPADRKMGARTLMGRPWRLSKTPMSITSPAPKFGDHNREVLRGVLGYTDAQCDELETAGILADRPTNVQPPPTMSLDDMVKQGRLAYVDPDFKSKLGI
ncbi:MAG: CoA transferase [SAR202 cluster bacterium]|jgi:crotonobetainyl-CoA:carnitine CoA-transferase CaiB-like acyl-CoA transferase|nr:CoA transferase [SAR202 cluster bacterium]MDP6301513.1 CoA transferase [SAR202 cluster bacterium]MDP7104976.1 CoA transferase [SAR202 cluster bacterium]MDP7226564.1 CoA transferase [SAR202 cluster bacterium]MDP7414782.1 CoA transferase [SAR202 cluster bacterium]|tara:strand:- start:4048 stop:5400 length:1353 start_codon:yes stop_codon:yes gene_type:complete